MIPRPLKWLAAGGGAAFVLVAAALAVFGRAAWDERQALVVRLAAELGGVEIQVEDVAVALDRWRDGFLGAQFTGVTALGTKIDRVSVGIEIFASLKERRAVLKGLTVSGFSLPPAAAQVEVESPKAETPPPDLATIWSSVLRFGTIRLENVEVATEALGIGGPLHVEVADLIATGAGVAHVDVRATLASSGPVVAAADVSLQGGAVRLANLSLAADLFQLAPFYYRYVDPSDPLPAEPLVVEHLDASGELFIGEDLVLVDLRKIALRSKMATATAVVYVKEAGEIFDYKVDVDVEDGTEGVLPGLPPALIGKDVSDWLATHLKTVKIKGATLRLHGDAAGLAALDLRLPVSGSRLAFAPGWPELEDVDAQVQVTADGLHVVGTGARIGELKLRGFTVDVPSFETTPRLTVDTRLEGDAEAVLATLAQTPLKGTVRDIRALPLRLSGPLASSLKVEVGLGDPEADGAVSVSGTAELLGVEAALTNAPVPPLTALRGRINFTHEHLASAGKLRGTLDGQEIAIAFDLPLTEELPVCKLEIDGTARLETVLVALGRSASDSLAGLARAHVTGEIGAAPGGAIAYSGKAELDLTAAGLALKGLMVKPAGVAAEAVLRFASAPSGPTLEAQYRSAAESASAKLAFSAERVSGDVVLALTNARGTIALPKGAGPIVAAFTRLHVTETQPTATATAAPAVSEAVAPALDPRDVPELQISCEDLVLGKRRLGRIELRTTKIPEGQSVDFLALDLGAASLYDTTGRWVMTPFGTDLSVKGKIYLRNGGEALQQLDLGDAVEGLRGNVDFAVSWPDLSTDLDARRLTARIAVDVREANIAAVDGVALKALDVLTLRFFDLTKEGLVIETATAELTFKAGHLAIGHARIESPTASLVAKGDLDFEEESVDAGVDVTLKISRTLNAVALGIVNPLLALGYLSQDADLTVVKLDGLTRHSYRVTGPWADPKVELGH